MTVRKQRRLSSSIAVAMTLSTTVAVIVCCALLAGVIYVALDRQAAAELTHQASAIAERVDDPASPTAVEDVQEAASFAPSGVRVTLIDSDGTVLFDNSGEDVSSMDNHLTRPEVVEAIEDGQGDAGRFSTTLGRETVYHSLLLSDGMVLRVSRTQDTVLGVMSGMAVPCLVVLIGVVLLSSVAGRMLSRRIASSVEEIDLDHPLENDAYDELIPLLCRVDEQRKRIDAAAAERRAFTANVSHELKTPLTVISGYAEIMGNGLAAPEDTARFSKVIHEEAQHMKGMVNDLIELSRLDDLGESARRADLNQQVDVAAVVHEAAGRVRQMAGERSVELSVNAAGSAIVRGNARIMRELVENLLSNAIRYNTEGGSVDVDVKAVEGGNVVLRVADTGVGIPPALRDRVFERFYRVDESRSKETGGSGLGLAIVKHAAQLHGASISIGDNSPQGTVITVAFPRD